MLVPGMHRLEFEGGNVVLTLFFGDIAEGLPQLQLAADAFYLDGFAPAKNPQMWEPRLLRHLGRLAAPGATVATWSVAASVREALQGAGFAVEKSQGFGTKREMLAGQPDTKNKESQKYENPHAPPSSSAQASPAPRSAERLASRGWQVTLIERHGGPAEEASGNPAGVFHPVVAPDDSLFARCTRAAFLYLLNHWKNLDGLAMGALRRAADGARRRSELASQRRALETLGYPARYAQFDEARGGIWFPEAGWVTPEDARRGLAFAF